MLILAFLFFSNSGSPDLQPFLSIVNQEGIFSFEGNKIYHLNFSNKVLCELDLLNSSAINRIDGHYFLQNNQELCLSIFDDSGKEVQRFPNTSWRYFKKLSPGLIYVVPLNMPHDFIRAWEEQTQKKIRPGMRLKTFHPGSQPYPNMVDLFSLKKNSDGFQVMPLKSFFRSTKKQKFFNFDYKNIFLVSSDETYYIMTELDKEIFVYTDKTIDEERVFDARSYFDKPSIKLDLPGFVEPKKVKEHFEPVYFERASYLDAIFSYHHSFSIIHSFKKTDFGFEIVYSVPAGDKNNTPNSVDVIILEVDMNGVNRTAPKTIENLVGEFAGIVGKNLYWLNKGQGKHSGMLEIHAID